MYQMLIGPVYATSAVGALSALRIVSPSPAASMPFRYTALQTEAEFIKFFFIPDITGGSGSLAKVLINLISLELMGYTTADHANT